MAITQADPFWEYKVVNGIGAYMEESVRRQFIPLRWGLSREMGYYEHYFLCSGIIFSKKKYHFKPWGLKISTSYFFQ